MEFVTCAMAEDKSSTTTRGSLGYVVRPLLRPLLVFD
jgi:hypothetical protein